MTALRFIALLPLLVPLLCVSAGSSYANSKAIGHIEYSSGNILLNHDGKTLLAGKDDLLFVDDTITTDKNSRAKINMNDGTSIYLARNSQVKIGHYDIRFGYRLSAALNLLYGTVRFIVTKIEGLDAEFTVKTDSATIGVKGADIRVSEPSTRGITEIMLYSGKVIVSTFKDSHELKPLTLARINTDGLINAHSLSLDDIDQFGIALKTYTDEAPNELADRHSKSGESKNEPLLTGTQDQGTKTIVTLSGLYWLNPSFSIYRH